MTAGYKAVTFNTASDYRPLLFANAPRFPPQGYD